MSILDTLIATLKAPENVRRESTLIVTTSRSTYEGRLRGAHGDALVLSVFGTLADSTTGPVGNDLLIPESEIRMIEIDWKDTYGLVNGDEEARVAYAMSWQK